MEVKCPKCGRFLAEAAGYVRVICRDCKVEVAVTAKAKATA